MLSQVVVVIGIVMAPAHAGEAKESDEQMDTVEHHEQSGMDDCSGGARSGGGRPCTVQLHRFHVRLKRACGTTEGCHAPAISQPARAVRRKATEPSAG